MKILVVNAGSSSLKYQLFNLEENQVIAKGICGRIGIDGDISHKTINGWEYAGQCDFPTHEEAFAKVIQLLTTGENKVVSDMSEISAVGHRVVHGGEHFSESTLITPEIIEIIEKISELAPLHNPPAVLAIKACIKALSAATPQVAVFDTAFHQTMPQKAYMFGIPYSYYEKYNIRRYGFHGTSHRFVSARMAEILNKDIKDLKMVTCHLGNGSSITAVDGGKSIDTSMGFTPLAGIIMGTRSGTIDPSVVCYMMEKEGLSCAQVSDVLNKESGYIGISGISNDDRDIRKAATQGNVRAQLVLDMQRYQIKKYIGEYAAAMGGLDAVVFTGGIGENSIPLRRDVCKNMEFFGIEFDEDKNERFNSDEVEISKPNSKVKVYIIPTNEELLIAQDTKKIVSNL